MDNRPYDSRFDDGDDAPLHLRSDPDETGPARRSPKRKGSKFKRSPREAQNAWKEQSLVVRGRLMRTKSLLLAALRVSELKQGIRD